MAVRRPLFQLVPEPRLALGLAITSLLWLLPGRAGTVAAIGALALILAAMVADAIALPTDRDLTIERTLPTNVGIGDTVSGEYVVMSRWGLPLRILLTDALPVGVSSSTRNAELTLRPHGSARLVVPVGGAVRGLFPLGAVGVRVRTRLGFMGRRLRWDLDDSILVTPSIAGVRRFRLLAVQQRLYEAGVRAVRLRGDGRSFASLREYV